VQKACTGFILSQSTSTLLVKGPVTASSPVTEPLIAQLLHNITRTHKKQTTHTSVLWLNVFYLQW